MACSGSSHDDESDRRVLYSEAEALMAAALGWGLLAASSLVIGALIAFLFRISCA